MLLNNSINKVRSFFKPKPPRALSPIEKLFKTIKSNPNEYSFKSGSYGRELDIFRGPVGYHPILTLKRMDKRYSFDSIDHPIKRQLTRHEVNAAGVVIELLLDCELNKKK